MPLDGQTLAYPGYSHRTAFWIRYHSDATNATAGQLALEGRDNLPSAVVETMDRENRRPLPAIKRYTNTMEHVA
jgi:hypothetical protein